MNARATVDIPIGRVELFGQIVHLVEDQGRLAMAASDETGQVVVLGRGELSAAGCRRLLRRGIDLLLDSAELALGAPSLQGNARQSPGRACRASASCRP